MRRVVLVMHARAVDNAAARLRELRHEEWGNLGLAALAFGLAIVATQVRPSLALPLFLGGVAVWFLGVRALWRRWDLSSDWQGSAMHTCFPRCLSVRRGRLRWRGSGRSRP